MVEPVKCNWWQISASVSWCRRCGTLREGSHLELKYVDAETGKEIVQSSTGYYDPLDGWLPGSVPEHYHHHTYGEPYSYTYPARAHERKLICGNEDD